MIVKFIVTDDRVLFGGRPYGDDYHRDLAERNSVRLADVRGDGLADLERRRIFGTSYGFGPYDPEVLRQSLERWEIEEPSSY